MTTWSLEGLQSHFLVSIGLPFAESKFHTYVERKPLRGDSAAWQRVMASEGTDISVPTEMESWVGADASMMPSEAPTGATATNQTATAAAATA